MNFVRTSEKSFTVLLSPLKYHKQLKSTAIGHKVLLISQIHTTVLLVCCPYRNNIGSWNILALDKVSSISSIQYHGVGWPHHTKMLNISNHAIKIEPVWPYNLIRFTFPCQVISYGFVEHRHHHRFRYRSYPFTVSSLYRDKFLHQRNPCEAMAIKFVLTSKFKQQSRQSISHVKILAYEIGL